MIVCICRGVSDREVRSAIDRGASSLLDLMRCGIGDQCGSCHHSLRMMLSEAAAAKSAQQPCPACTGAEAPAAAATA